MSAKKETPNPFKKKKSAGRLIDEVLPDKREQAHVALVETAPSPVKADDRAGHATTEKSVRSEETQPVAKQEAPEQQAKVAQPKAPSTKSSSASQKRAAGRIRMTFDIDLLINRQIKRYADDLYLDYGSVSSRFLVETALRFALENQDAFDAFVRGKLPEETR